MTEHTAPHVLITGGGVGALETLIALRDLAGDRVHITLVAPEAAFSYRPMKVAEPFVLGHAREYELADVAGRFAAGFIRDKVAEVRPDDRTVRCDSGQELRYHHLVLATGARARPAFRHAITFGDDPAEERPLAMFGATASEAVARASQDRFASSTRGAGSSPVGRRSAASPRSRATSSSRSSRSPPASGSRRSSRWATRSISPATTSSSTGSTTPTRRSCCST